MYIPVRTSCSCYYSNWINFVKSSKILSGLFVLTAAPRVCFYCTMYAAQGHVFQLVLHYTVINVINLFVQFIFTLTVVADDRFLTFTSFSNCAPKMLL